MNNYRFSETSLRRMTGVRPECVRCAFYVIERVKVLDVTIPRYGGLRTREEQEYLVAKGASRKLRSAHLEGYALDIVPYLNGPRWDRTPRKAEPGEDQADLNAQSRLVKASYNEIWKLWNQAAEEFEYQFKARISWDWPHHELRR